MSGRASYAAVVEIKTVNVNVGFQLSPKKLRPPGGDLAPWNRSARGDTTQVYWVIKRDVKICCAAMISGYAFSEVTS